MFDQFNNCHIKLNGFWDDRTKVISVTVKISLNILKIKLALLEVLKLQKSVYNHLY